MLRPLSIVRLSTKLCQLWPGSTLQRRTVGSSENAFSGLPTLGLVQRPRARWLYSVSRCMDRPTLRAPNVARPSDWPYAVECCEGSICAPEPLDLPAKPNCTQVLREAWFSACLKDRWRTQRRERTRCSVLVAT